MFILIHVKFYLFSSVNSQCCEQPLHFTIPCRLGSRSGGGLLRGTLMIPFGCGSGFSGSGLLFGTFRRLGLSFGINHRKIHPNKNPRQKWGLFMVFIIRDLSECLLLIKATGSFVLAILTS